MHIMVRNEGPDTKVCPVLVKFKGSRDNFYKALHNFIKAVREWQNEENEGAIHLSIDVVGVNIVNDMNLRQYVFDQLDKKFAGLARGSMTRSASSNIKTVVLAYLEERENQRPLHIVVSFNDNFGTPLLAIDNKPEIKAIFNIE